MGRLTGRTAIVTGAARGTGEAAARLLVEQGARVLLTDVLDEPGGRVAAELGAAAAYRHLDVRSEVEWSAAVGFCEEHWGRLDVLVNNAAVLLMCGLVDTEPAEYERVVAVNQLGVFLGMRAAAPAMRRAGGGSIVNVASIDAIRAQSGLVAYVASKWAVRGMSRVAALELGRFGIRVNTVCPEAGSPHMVAPYMPEGVDMERVMAAQQPVLSYQKQRSIADRVRDVAQMIAFLASDESLSCTGADFSVDGGNMAGKLLRHLPGS